MKNSRHFLILLCIGLVSTACVSSPPKVNEPGPENNAGFSTHEQGPLETSAATTITSTNKTLIQVDPVADVDSQQAAKPIFSGKWILNRELSDNFQEKIKENLQQAGNAQGNKGMQGGHGGKGSGGGGGRGGMQKGGSASKKQNNGGRQKLLPQELLTLLTESKTLQLKHEEPLLTIITHDDQRQQVYTDFRGASVSVSGGPSQRIVTAGWENDVLVVETTIESGSFIQRYKLHTKSRQLWVSALILIPSLPKPVQFNRVYDLTETRTEEVCIDQNTGNEVKHSCKDLL